MREENAVSAPEVSATTVPTMRLVQNACAISKETAIVDDEMNIPGDEKEVKKEIEIVPFTNGLDHLNAWFGALGDAPPSELLPLLVPTEVPKSVYAQIPALLLRTVRSVEGGITLPFEEFSLEHDLDVVDRLILLALLREAHGPRSGCGISVAHLFLAVEATTLSRRLDVLSRIEELGKLRDLRMVECLPGWTRDERRYRLAERFVGPLTHGGIDTLGLPILSPDPIEALQALATDVRLLGAVLTLGCLDAHKVWGGARQGGPGWDSTAPWREVLEARLEASARSESDRIGEEIRRLRLEGSERVAWALLLADADEEEVGVKVPRIVQATGRHIDPEGAAEELLGPESKLGRADCIRFNRADGSVLGRIAWLSREARGRVIPWPRGAFYVKPGVDLEALPFTPRVGFDPYGTQTQDRIAAKGVSR